MTNCLLQACQRLGTTQRQAFCETCFPLTGTEGVYSLQEFNMPDDLSDAGWALCGHETPAGQAQDIQTESMHCDVPVQAPSARYVVQQQAGTGNTEAAHAAVSTAGSKSASETANQSEPIDAAAQLSRDRRIDLGQKCKQVIDKGREQWLRQQGFQVKELLICLCISQAQSLGWPSEPDLLGSLDLLSSNPALCNHTVAVQVQSVLYVDPKVSGENRLLLGIARSTLPNNI